MLCSRKKVDVSNGCNDFTTSIHTLTIILKLKLCLGKNSVICSDCTINKCIVVSMASKVGYEVCMSVKHRRCLHQRYWSSQESVTGRCSGVSSLVVPCKPGIRRKSATIVVPSSDNGVINSKTSYFFQ